jgi:hypothetical protein
MQGSNPDGPVNIMYLYGSACCKYLMLLDSDSTAFSRFEYGIKSDVTKQKYVKRLELFFDFYKVEGGDIEIKSDNFLRVIRNGKNVQKLTDLVMRYMSYCY